MGNNEKCDELGSLFRKWELSQYCPSVRNDERSYTADIKTSNTITAIVIMMSGKIISGEETLQYFYSNQPNRKQLCFWLSQCFSTEETIPVITLFWALESRGAIKTPHMIKESVCNLKKTNTNINPIQTVYLIFNPNFSVSTACSVVNQHRRSLYWSERFLLWSPISL